MNRGKWLNVSLWIAQVLLAIVFCGAGMFKLGVPIVELAASIPWAGHVPATFVRFIGMVDLARGWAFCCLH